MVLFGMALTIPKHEAELCKQLNWPAWAVLSLTNDLQSWEKEEAEAKRSGEPLKMNAISFLMGQRPITEAEAKTICRGKIQKYVAQYLQNVDGVKRNPNLSSDLRIYLEALKYSISGNAVWGLYTPRYRVGG